MQEVYMGQESKYVDLQDKVAFLTSELDRLRKYLYYIAFFMVFNAVGLFICVGKLMTSVD